MDRKHYDDEHLAFGEAFRAFVDKIVVPALPRLGARRASRPREVFTEAGKGGFLGMAVPEQYGGGGVDDFRFNQILDEQIADGRHHRRRARHHAAQRHLPALLPRLRHRRAEAALAARHRVRRADHRRRHDRARRRLRPRRHPHQRQPRRRPLRRQRQQDLHHQRHQRRPRHHRRADRRRDRHTAASRCSSSSAAWPASSAAATSTSSACTRRTPPSCPSPTSACRSRTCSARRARASRYLTAEAAAGAHVDRRRRRGRGPRRVRRDAALRARTARRSASPSASFQNTKFVLADIATEIDVAQAFLDRCVDRLNAGELTPPTRPRPSGGAPSCRAASSTAACSCTAATAT